MQQAGRQVPPPSKHPGAARRSRRPHCPMPPPSKHAGAARRSQNLHCNARNLSPIYATGNMERVGGKNTKGCELQGKALHARIRWMRKKRKTRKESADGLDPEKYPVPCADRSPMSHPCCRPATVLPLLPPSHTSAGGGGDLGNHTSPQSSWSDSWWHTAYEY